MHVISTQELEHQIRESEEPAVLSEDVFLVPNLAGYLSGLLHRHGSTVQEVVVGCNLDRSCSTAPGAPPGTFCCAWRCCFAFPKRRPSGF